VHRLCLARNRRAQTLATLDRIETGSLRTLAAPT